MTDVQAAVERAAPGPERKDLYRKSYLLLRVVIGVMGIALPLALFLGDWLFLAGSPAPRGSLSAYYHSGMRDVFVGILCVVGIFLITYRVEDYKWDNRLSTFAGVLALGVAIFPTGAPPGRQTELQKALGETVVAWIHFSSAALFILLLAAIGFNFGWREKQKPSLRLFHWACAGTIIFALLFIAVTKVFGFVDDYSLLIGETVAVVAFGLSWLVKGHPVQLIKTAQAA